MFEITPYVGASLIKFGMKREEVRKVFSEYEPRAFWRNSYSESALLLMAMMKLVLIYIMIVLIKLKH